MNYFGHICILIIASTSATTGAIQVQPEMHPLVQPHKHPLMYLYGDR